MQYENMTKIAAILSKAKAFSDEIIEATVIEYVRKKTGAAFCYHGFLGKYQNKQDDGFIRMQRSEDPPARAIPKIGYSSDVPGKNPPPSFAPLRSVREAPFTARPPGSTA